jgi:phosphoribosylaminoimidazole-succinocarboxamide synthase
VITNASAGIPPDIQQVMYDRMPTPDEMRVWRAARRVALLPVFAKQLLPLMTDFFFQDRRSTMHSSPASVTRPMR